MVIGGEQSGVERFGCREMRLGFAGKYQMGPRGRRRAVSGKVRPADGGSRDQSRQRRGSGVRVSVKVVMVRARVNCFGCNPSGHLREQGRGCEGGAGNREAWRETKVEHWERAKGAGVTTEAGEQTR